MKPEWQSRRDPERHPVRCLAGLWEQRTGTHFTPKEYGQLRDLRTALGEFTREVIEWMLDPIHWCRFCQQVRAESGVPSAPPSPHVGFLLKHHGRALRIMRVELQASTTAAHVSFCTRLDQRRFEQWKTFVCVYAAGRPEWVAAIEAASTLTEIQRVFLQLVDATTPALTSVSS